MMIGISWIGLVNPGSYNNVLLPTHASLSVITGIFISNRISIQDKLKLQNITLLLMLTVQLIILKYPIQSQIPTQEDLQFGKSLVQNIIAWKGDIYVPYHPDMMLFAGKKLYANWISLKELKAGFGGEKGSVEWLIVKMQLQSAYRHRKFSLIISDRPDYFGGPERYYQLIGEVEYPTDRTFIPVTGWQTRPVLIYIPKSDGL